jgi:LasA protease
MRKSTVCVCLLLCAAASMLAAAPAMSAPPVANAHLGLPWKVGESATFLAGPHYNLKHECGSQPPACNSLDFAPSSGVVRAAAAGVVHFPYCGAHHKLVVIDHGGGWFTGYYHMAAPTVKAGQFVDEGEPLGSIGEDLSCGGEASGRHVHFFVKYVPGCESASARSEVCFKKLGDPFKHTSVDVALDGQEIGGWRISGTLYHACMTHISPAEKRCEGQQVLNYPAGPSLPGLPAELGTGPPLSVRPPVIGYTGDGSGWLGGFDGNGRNDHFGHMRWPVWTASRAEGVGAVWIDACNPNCAAGTFAPHAVTVRAFAPRAGYFTRLTLSYRYARKQVTDERAVRRFGTTPGSEYFSYEVLRVRLR